MVDSAGIRHPPLTGLTPRARALRAILRASKRTSTSCVLCRYGGHSGSYVSQEFSSVWREGNAPRGSSAESLHSFDIAIGAAVTTIAT